MHINVKLFLYMFLMALFNIVYSGSPIKIESGRWCWEGSSDVSTFSITITKTSSLFIGGYDAVAFRGDKIDENDKAFYFKNTNSNIIKTKIRAGISGDFGVIKLKFLNDGKIEWLVTQFPQGEFYVPSKAILKKC